MSKEAVHSAIQADLLDEDEIAICWVLIVDVAGPDDTRYLAHRAGGGHDGEDNPMAWAALGMLRAGVGAAEDQLRASTFGEDDEEEEGEAA